MAQIGSFGHLKLNGVSVLSLQLPSHIASVLLVLISSPETNLKSSRSFNSLLIEFWSLKKTVVSSAYCENLISLGPTLIPLIELSYFRALARSSIPITNKSPDRGQPCLTPVVSGKTATCDRYLLRSWRLHDKALLSNLRNLDQS